MITSFHTATLHELPVLEAVDRLLDAGYDAVELNAEELPWAAAHLLPDTSQELLDELARRPVSSIAAHRAGLASPGDSDREEAFSWTARMIEIAAHIGAPVVHVIPGDQPDVGNGLGVASEPGDLGCFVESLRALVAVAQEHDVVLALEPIVNQLVSTTDETLEVLRRVPGLWVSFDPSHLEVTTHDVVDAARRLGPRVAIAALKDATGTPEDFRFLAPGDGDIDFVAVVAELRSHGFDGALVVEHEAHLFGDERGPDQVVEDSLKAARALLR